MATKFDTEIDNIKFSFNMKQYRGYWEQKVLWVPKCNNENMYKVNLTIYDEESHWRHHTSFYVAMGDYPRYQQRCCVIDLIWDNVKFPEKITGRPEDTEELKRSMMMLRRLMRNDFKKN